MVARFIMYITTILPNILQIINVKNANSIFIIKKKIVFTTIYLNQLC